MRNSELAEELVVRLNALLGNAAVRADIERLLDERIEVTKYTADHPTIQVISSGGKDLLGFLGLLNGIVGNTNTKNAISYGYIAAKYDSDGDLVGFSCVKD
jgi:hypothetical protein